MALKSDRFPKTETPAEDEKPPALVLDNFTDWQQSMVRQMLRRFMQNMARAHPKIHIPILPDINAPMEVIPADEKPPSAISHIAVFERWEAREAETNRLIDAGYKFSHIKTQ